MNRISDLTRRLWAALLALCLVLALTLPVFAEGESGTADTAEKETFHIGTVDDLLQLVVSCPGQLEQKPHRLSGRRSGTDRQRLCGHPVLQRRI